VPDGCRVTSVITCGSRLHAVGRYGKKRGNHSHSGFRYSPDHDRYSKRRDPAVYEANASPLAGFRPTDTRHLVLRHTLSIATARTEDQLICRTLAAACAVADATVAMAVNPTFGHRLHGAKRSIAALSGLGETTLGVLRHSAAGPTNVLAHLAMPSAITAFLGDTLIVVAAEEPHQLAVDTPSLLALLLAHATAGQDRLQEVVQLSLRADSDPLTGLRHHRPFQRGLAASCPGRTAVIAIDVDCFKKINDEYGHLAGDRALVRLADALRGALRDEDQLFRIGGDEFAVILDINGPGEASAVAQRLMDAARRVGQTISVGTAVHARGESGTQLLARADKALYEAKRAGRDTVRLAA
jgi:diguanylate cyclase (GGDEF)-like protein